MTPQEAFNLAYKGVIAQGGKSVIRPINEKNMCAYRGENAMKCGIGHLMSDEEYQITFEGESAGNQMLIKACQFGVLSKEFLIKLQRAHDEAPIGKDFIIKFKMNMEDVAQEFKFEIPDVD